MASRLQLEAAIDFACEGDVFTKLDRLARSVADMLTIQNRLTAIQNRLTAIQNRLTAKGVALRIVNPGLDTATPTAKLMLNLLASIAQFEREIMLERQREGIRKAKDDGKYNGRAPTVQRQSATILAEQLGVDRSSVYRVLGPTWQRINPS